MLIYYFQNVWIKEANSGASNNSAKNVSTINKNIEK